MNFSQRKAKAAGQQGQKTGKLAFNFEIASRATGLNETQIRQLQAGKTPAGIKPSVAITARKALAGLSMGMK